MLDILDIRTQLPTTASFLPLVEQPAFWIGQAIPAAVLLLLGLGLCIRKRQEGRSAPTDFEARKAYSVEEN